LAAAALALLGCAPGAPVPAEPGRRVVTIGPGTEANLGALGLAGVLVGVSDWCTAPEAEGIPRVGGQADPNLERIAALAPELVLVQGRIPQLQQWCDDSGIEFRAFATDSLAAWREEMEWLGARFGRYAEAARLVGEMDAALGALASTGPPRRTLLVIARREEEASGIVAAGCGSFLSELLVRAGGVNVLPAGGAEYPEISEETLVRLDPEAIVEFHPGGAAGGDALATWRRAFPSLAAVRDSRVGAVRHREALLPGPRMHEVAREIHALLR
jgi:iron complex transport system substrate-binding protein